MATVYLAQDLKHHRQIAIKVLHPEIARALGSDRFLREITVTAGLHHPHILPLYDSGEVDVPSDSELGGALLYYVMPYVEGESLRDRLKRDRQLPIEQALRIAREVADALTYAHGKGVVHRDIKPENILLEAGHALVADFGIARAVTAAGGEPLTETGLAIGTPAYMSPEQAIGRQDLDGRSDLYSLACVFYEMLAGQPPFTGPGAESVVHQHLTAEPRPITQLRPAVPAEISRILSRSLAKTPADRYDSVAQFAAAFSLVETASRSVPGHEGLGHSIAVLPFANLSAEPETEYFSDGITEEIINALAQVEDLRVAARTSSFAFKGKALDVAEIAAKLHVGTVLEGSVRRAGKRLRVTAQLINAADGFHLWSERYDRDLEDVFAIQDEIARAIADKLRVTLTAKRDRALVRPGTGNLEAYDLFLKGRYHWARRGAALTKAIELFDRAIAIDPNFAAAYAGLADAYCILTSHGYYSPTRGYEQARAAAYRALALDSESADAHQAVGLFELVMGWDLAAAERAMRRACELNPSNAYPSYVLGQLTTSLGRTDEAVAAIRRAQQVEPLSPLINAGVGLVYFRLNAEPEALEAAQTSLDLDPAFPFGYWVRGMVHDWHERREEAVGEFEQAVRFSGNSPMLLSMLGCVCARAGHRERARTILAEIEGRETGAGSAAMLYWHLGDQDRAFTLFEQAVQERTLPWVTPYWPGTDELTADVRWTALLERAGLGLVAHARR
jgi:serine/threonine-protein kinase